MVHHHQKHETEPQYESGGFYPRQKNHLPVSRMAFKCDLVVREGHTQPPFQIATHGVGGDGVNGKPENDEPEGRFGQFEEPARITTAVRLSHELPAETANGLPSGAAK